MSERLLRLALPAGSLQEATVALLRKAGYRLSLEGRSYYPTLDDPEIACTLIRAQEIPRYVQDGLMDAGLTGYDWIRENGASVVEVAELLYSKASRRPVRWVFAVPQASPIHSLRDLEGKRIATEVVNITREFLEERGVHAIVEFSWGATEAKPPQLADAVVEATETGASLRANDLRELETLLESTPRFIASPAAWADPWKRRKIEDVALMLHGALAAEGKVGLMLNVRSADLDAVVAILPALKRPTISSLSDPDWVAINTVVDESVVREIIPRLKQAGAQGIVEYPLNKIIE
ncbi:MAG: ATP phosphoribosyltransferase [Chloroflexi bacterium RBG_16_68_14]|nr:MAG: ATP phosphoribosyltransferase [Chloroflexi bacterium RBG_16_68_14]